MGTLDQYDVTLEEMEARAEKVRKHVEKRWKYTRQDAKYDLLVKALQDFGNEAILHALVESLEEINLASLNRGLSEFLHRWDEEGKEEDFP